MKVGYLGTGSWGYCLATILASKGYYVVCWTTKAELAATLNKTRSHPFLPAHKSKGNLFVTTDLEETLADSDLLVESVTSAGLRPVLEKVHAIDPNLSIPLIITSKGIEQDTGLILPDVAIEVFGERFRPLVGVLSGPGYASEVIQGLPTSVVASGYSASVIQTICDTFATENFRVYPNSDVRGVAFGGSLKNIIAIACGIADGLSLGNSAKAALMTRGLHEIRKLAVACGCKAETLNGLSGMGDLCMTCSSPLSRNYRFGNIIAKGTSPAEAHREIKMVVEGAYTCLSALQLSAKYNVRMPITDTVYKILYEQLKPRDAVMLLMKRPIKEESA